MEQAYLHPEIAIAQSAKKPNACGDVVHVVRQREGTLLLLCDGIGSGVKANLAARMLIARFEELLDGGFSLRSAFARVVETLNKYRAEGVGYVAFTVVWILPHGGVSVLTHDAPNPVRIMGPGQACVAKMEYETVGHAVVGEGSFVLRKNEGLLAMSDGITQSGLAVAMRQGWMESDIAQWVRVMASNDVNEIARKVHRQALEYWGATNGDDCTAVAIALRPGKRVAVFTGPPEDKKNDADIVGRLMKFAGVKIVCGGSTSNIVGRVLGRKVEIDAAADNPLIPPSFHIDGIDLVTEGIVTLNQVCNLIGSNEPEDNDNAVERFCAFLHDADRVDFLVGQARNPAGGSRTLQQLGVVERNRIVDAIAQRLRAMDKLVLVEKV